MLLPKKIIIIGEAGRGKSTLAQKLSEKLSIPYYSTDDFFWATKYTMPRDRQDASRCAENAYTQQAWIVEGTTQWLLQPGLAHADIIIFLTFKTIFHQWASIIKRYFNGKDHETFFTMLGLLKHVFLKRYGLGYKKGALTHRQIIAPYIDKVIELDSFEKINDFIKNQ
jgi:adenylate kinase family enzyme